MSPRQKLRKRLKWIARKHGSNGFLPMLFVVQNCSASFRQIRKHKPREWRQLINRDGFMVREAIVWKQPHYWHLRSFWA